MDTQNVLQQSTIARSTLDAIPTTKRLGNYATLLLGAVSATATAHRQSVCDTGEPRSVLHYGAGA